MSANKYNIREICGDWALDIHWGNKTITLFFNSRNNAELVKAILEWEDNHPNEVAVVVSGLAAAAGNEKAAKYYELFKAGLDALRPITREQVEKVWKPCKVCNGKTTLYQHTNTTKLFMNTFGKATTLVTECNACPPYADCCMKGISANSAFRISYCPECGRPLTDEAVDMVMNRLEALYEET